MDGCLLEDAFEIPASKKPGKSARREEREKARRCKGPAMAFLDKGGEDFGSEAAAAPDRQGYSKKPVPAKEESFVGMMEGESTEKSGQEKRIEKMPQVPKATALPVASGKPAYFGADPLEEGFAPYNVPYTMQVDFKDSFQKAGLGAAGSGTRAMGATDFKDVWGPLVPSGGVSSLLTGGVQDKGIIDLAGDKELQKKLDTILARLDDLEAGRQGTEHAQSEILLFVMTGVFLIFSMDLVAGRR